MRWLLLLVGMLISGCGVAPQPESNKTIAAFEIPLPSEEDRSEFLALIRAEAAADGLHVDAASRAELVQTAEIMPNAAMTIHAAVYRGRTDDQSEAVIMDSYDHLGQVWLMFSRGEDVPLAARFRERLMKKVMARWPNTLSLPVMPTGAIPLHRHLRATTEGYKLDPAEIDGYGVDPDSPLVLQNKAG